MFLKYVIGGRGLDKGAVRGGGLYVRRNGNSVGGGGGGEMEARSGRGGVYYVCGLKDGLAA